MTTVNQRIDDLERKLAPSDIYKVYVIWHDPETGDVLDLLTWRAPVDRDPGAKVIRVKPASIDE